MFSYYYVSQLVEKTLICLRSVFSQTTIVHWNHYDDEIIKDSKFYLFKLLNYFSLIIDRIINRIGEGRDAILKILF